MSKKDINFESFKEEDYKKMKDNLDKIKSDWQTLSELNPEKGKREVEIYKYTQSIKFLSWYLIKEFELKNKILYDSKEYIWYMYFEKEFLWKKVENFIVEELIERLAQEPFPFEINGHLKNSKKRDLLIIEQLKHHLKKDIKLDENNQNLIVFRDKVINIITKKKVKEISPTLWITQYNPNIWDEYAECPLIEEWFRGLFPATLYTKEEIDERWEVFLAICNIEIQTNRRFQAHFYLEIAGVAGSGKSLMQTLLASLVSEDKRTTSSLKVLHKSVFETSTFKDKHLIMFPESEEYFGDPSIFKSITGGDAVRYEPKYGKKGTFIYNGIVVITSNKKMSLSTLESSILRRRILFKFLKQVDLKKINTNLLNIDSNTGLAIGDWASQIPGLIQKAVKMDNAKDIITKYLAKQKHISDDFPIQFFMKIMFVPFKNGKLSVRTHTFSYPVYDIYLRFCAQEGLIPLKKSKFEEMLEMDFGSVFPGYEIKITRNNTGGTTISGLMYIQLLDKSLYPAIVKAHREAHGLRSYYDLERDQDLFDILTYKNQLDPKPNTNISNLIYEINQQDTLFKNLGLAISETNPKPFEPNYTLNYLIDQNVEHYKNYVVLVEKTDELQNFLILVLSKIFVPSLSEADVISTQEIFDELIKMLLQHKKRTNLKPNQLKAKVFDALKIVYPVSKNYQQIKEANNIGEDKLKGFMHIKRRT